MWNFNEEFRIVGLLISITMLNLYNMSYQLSIPSSWDVFMRCRFTLAGEINNNLAI